MLIADVTTAKKDLSRLLRRVKKGERVIITERNRPIALLRPFTVAGTDGADPNLEHLYQVGALTPPIRPTFDVAAFLASPRGTLAAGHELSAAVLAERAEGR